MSEPNNGDRHPFEGSMQFCMRCFRPKEHAVHTDAVASETAQIVPDAVASGSIEAKIESDAVASETSISVEDFQKFMAEQLEITPEDQASSDAVDDMIQVEADLQAAENRVIAGATAPESQPDIPQDQPVAHPGCAGHICTVCGKGFDHSYKCSEGTSIVCKDCKAQAVADKNRQHFINGLNNKILTGAEEVELTNKYTDFIVAEMAGKDNWQELIEAHILDLRRKIEMFKVNMMCAVKVRRSKEEQEMANLTAEQAAEYRKQAERQPKKERAKKEGDSANSKSSTGSRMSKDERLARDMMKLMPNLTLEQALKFVKGEK